MYNEKLILEIRSLLYALKHSNRDLRDVLFHGRVVNSLLLTINDNAIKSCEKLLYSLGVGASHAYNRDTYGLRNPFH